MWSKYVMQKSSTFKLSTSTALVDSGTYKMVFKFKLNRSPTWQSKRTMQERKKKTPKFLITSERKKVWFSFSTTDSIKQCSLFSLIISILEKIDVQTYTVTLSSVLFFNFKYCLVSLKKHSHPLHRPWDKQLNFEKGKRGLFQFELKSILETKST